MSPEAARTVLPTRLWPQVRRRWPPPQLIVDTFFCRPTTWTPTTLRWASYRVASPVFSFFFYAIYVNIFYIWKIHIYICHDMMIWIIYMHLWIVWKVWMFPTKKNRFWWIYRLYMDVYGYMFLFFACKWMQCMYSLREYVWNFIYTSMDWMQCMYVYEYDCYILLMCGSICVKYLKMLYFLVIGD